MPPAIHCLMSYPSMLSVASSKLRPSMSRSHHAHEQAKAQLNAVANEWADDNDLCGRYDEFMEEHGFNGPSNST